jgi:dTDP-4-amino-4,6-dideoxygalactose transaminase
MTRPKPEERIPLVDLRAQADWVREETTLAWDRVLEKSEFILGEDVADFEGAFAAYCGVRYCVGVGNGTDALEFLLRAIDVGPGDEVILPANSFVATAGAVIRAGATPLFVDVDPDSLLVTPAQVFDRLTARTRAIIAVDLYGQMPPMEEMASLIERGVLLIEDAAQAHGSSRHGISPGGFGVGAATSFYPGKNLGAFGDAGAVLTNSEKIASSVRLLRSHGSRRKYEHLGIGFNSRLDTMQAVVLQAKLSRLPEWNLRRREAAARYDALLRETPHIVRLSVLAGNQHSWHLYVIEIPERDRVLRIMHQAGIEVGIHYPTPIHLLPGYRFLNYERGDFPVAEHASDRVLSLPMFPGITAAQQERVVEKLEGALL